MCAAQTIKYAGTCPKRKVIAFSVSFRTFDTRSLMETEPMVSDLRVAADKVKTRWQLVSQRTSTSRRASVTSRRAAGNEQRVRISLGVNTIRRIYESQELRSQPSPNSRAMVCDMCLAPLRALTHQFISFCCGHNFCMEHTNSTNQCRMRCADGAATINIVGG